MAYQIDFRSETWKALAELANTRLDDARKKNDGQLDATQTAYLRGRIAELKQLLTLPKAGPAQVADE